ncbi:hypothetical protein K469DRAFT_706140, partial [Zopfia rhizophila CBS 207.26]
MSYPSATGFGSAWPKPPPRVVGPTSIRTSMKLDCVGTLTGAPVSAHVLLGTPY